MEKVKLAVCIEDLEYRQRLIRCMMNHYKNQYEIYVYTSLGEIKKGKNFEHQAILLGGVSRNEISDFINRGEKIIFLQDGCGAVEKDMLPANLVYTEKYQEVYKIVDEIEKLTGNTQQRVAPRTDMEKPYYVVGIYSPSQSKWQLPFAATLASVFGERVSCVLVDQQPFSGLSLLEPDEAGMEDFMSIATTGVYTKGRLLEGIGHQENWDYVYPVKNVECLAESSKEICESMQEILVKELGYKVILINFGAVYFQVLEQMEACDVCYLLTSKNDSGIWREKAFFQNLEERGQQRFLQKIRRFELPEGILNTTEWLQVVQQWRWNEIGNKLRSEVVSLSGMDK